MRWTQLSGSGERGSPIINALLYRTDRGVQGPVSRNDPEIFRAHKATFSSSVSESGEEYPLETSCLKGTSVHIKNTMNCWQKKRDRMLRSKERWISIPHRVTEANFHFVNGRRHHRQSRLSERMIAYPLQFRPGQSRTVIICWWRKTHSPNT